MTWMDDLVVAYRDHGLRVHEGANWRSFGVGDWADGGRPHACIKHQFVWPPGNSDQGAVDMLTNGYNTGSYFLNPPVANTFLGKSLDGDVYMIGGRVAQHAGYGVRAVYDRAIQDLPPVGDGQNAPGPDDWVGGSFYYWGTETHHYYEEPFAQYDALLRMSVAECQVFGWSANRILEHSNTTTRKQPDLVALDGNRLRADIAALLNSPKDQDMSAAELKALQDQINDLRQVGLQTRATSEQAMNAARSADAKAAGLRQPLLEANARAEQAMNAARSADRKADAALGKLDQLIKAVTALGGEVPPLRPTSYTVQDKDTLTSIAAKFEISLAALLVANPQITDPDNVVVRTVLNIPPKV